MQKGGEGASGGAGGQDRDRFIADAHRALLKSTNITHNLQAQAPGPPMTSAAPAPPRHAAVAAPQDEAAVMHNIREAALAAAAAADPGLAFAALASPSAEVPTSPPPPYYATPVALGAGAPSGDTSARPSTTTPPHPALATVPAQPQSGRAFQGSTAAGASAEADCHTEQESAAQMQGGEEAAAMPQSTGTSIVDRQPVEANSHAAQRTAAGSDTRPCATGGTGGSGGTGGTGESASAATSNRPHASLSAGVSAQLAAALLLDGGALAPATSALGQPPPTAESADPMSPPPAAPPSPCGAPPMLGGSGMVTSPQPLWGLDAAGVASAPGMRSCQDSGGGALQPPPPTEGQEREALPLPTAGVAASAPAAQQQAAPVTGVLGPGARQAAPVLHGSSGQATVPRVDPGASAQGSHEPVAAAKSGTMSKAADQRQEATAASGQQGDGEGGSGGASGLHATTAGSRAAAGRGAGQLPLRSSDDAEGGTTVPCATAAVVHSGMAAQGSAAGALPDPEELERDGSGSAARGVDTLGSLAGGGTGSTEHH